jgi:hypothetical protein
MAAKRLTYSIDDDVFEMVVKMVALWLIEKSETKFETFAILNRIKQKHALIAID